MTMPQSLTARLACLFAVVVTLALTGIGTYALYALQSQLQYRDTELVHRKVDQITHLLREMASNSTRADIEHHIDYMVRGYEGLAIRVRTGDALLFGTDDTLGDFDLATDEGRQARARLQARHWIVAGAAGTLGQHAGSEHAAPATTVTVAQDGQDRIEVIQRFRASLVVATGVGVVLATVVGAFLARRELKPAHRLAKQVNRVNVEKLEYRVAVPARPTEVRMVASAFNAMLERVETGYERLYRFSADLAHDLRTPLNNLIGHAEVALSRERTAAEYAQLVEDSLDEYQRLSRMIDAMLFLARADGANVQLDRVQIDLDKELRKLVDYFSVLAEDQGLAISVSTHRHASGKILADSLLFRRAINNLLANAIQHAHPHTEIVVRVSSGSESGDDPAGETIVHVDNLGKPIAPDDVGQVFERFYRGDRSRSNSARSTGLGLAIVRTIMDLHGGTATAMNLPGGVTRFALRFPAQDTGSAPPAV
jgi:two-component system heavy metal sensor histidine kinase CusS